MRYIFLALFVVFSLVHLYASYNDNVRLRHLTKSGILIFLTLFYIFSSGDVNPIMIAAMAFSLLGDMALQFKKLFALGGIFFMCSHVCFIIVYFQWLDFSAVPIWAFLVPVVYAVAVFKEMRELKPGHIPRKLYPPMFLYLCINAAMNSVAFWLFSSRPCLATGLVYLGALCFFVSDSILFIVRFHKQKQVWRKHFPVMLTYILAELLITLGVLMCEKN